MRRLEGSYCPLCGELGLALKVKGQDEWAYCAREGSSLEDSHTSFVVRQIGSVESAPAARKQRATGAKEAEE